MTAIAQLKRDRRLARSTSSWGETALQAASHLGHRALIAQLVDVGTSLDIFAAAAIADTTEVVSMLADRPKDICGVHRLPLLHFAVVSRDLGMVEALIAAGACLSPPAASLSPLHAAVAVDSAPIVRSLLRAGADVAFTDAFGQTALDWAYELCIKDREMLELLLGSRSSARR